MKEVGYCYKWLMAKKTDDRKSDKKGIKEFQVAGKLEWMVSVVIKKVPKSDTTRNFESKALLKGR